MGILPMCLDMGSACYSCLSTLPEGVSVFRLLRQSAWNAYQGYAKAGAVSMFYGSSKKKRNHLLIMEAVRLS